MYTSRVYVVKVYLEREQKKKEDHIPTGYYASRYVDLTYGPSVSVVMFLQEAITVLFKPPFKLLFIARNNNSIIDNSNLD